MIETLKDLENSQAEYTVRARVAATDLTERGRLLHLARLAQFDEQIAKLTALRIREVERHEAAEETLRISRAALAHIRKRIKYLKVDKRIQQIAALQSELQALQMEIEDDGSCSPSCTG